MERIEEFRGDFAFLSNFYPAIFTFNFRLWGSAEIAYQAAKTRNVEDIEWIRSSKTAAIAKRRGGPKGEDGRSITVREGWEGIKVAIMRRIVLAKFLQNPGLRAQLLATGDAVQIEGNYWGDREWGVCRGKGKNMLGILLMEVRDVCVSES